MNLPLLLPRILFLFLSFLVVFIGMSLYLMKCKFKNSLVKKCMVIFSLFLTGLIFIYTLSYTISTLNGRAQVNTQLFAFL